MLPSRLLTAVAALTFAHAGFAAEGQPPAAAQSPCMQAVQASGDEGARHKDDADIDGDGACRLADGYVASAARTNGGASPGGLLGGDDAAPGRHRFGDDADLHALRGGRRVVTVDMSTSEQRAGLDMSGTRHGTDLFRQSGEYIPVAWEEARFGYVSAAGAADVAASPLAPVELGAAVSGLEGGPVTSRSGSRSLDAGAGTSPASPVPEPAAWVLLATGFGVLLLRRRRA